MRKQLRSETERIVMLARLSRSLKVFPLLLLTSSVLLAQSALAEHTTLYVDSTATENGDGSRRRPFSYTVTDLGTLGGTSSVGCGINSRGQVVGFSSIATGQLHAFLWHRGVMTDLGTLPGDFFSLARDINKHAQVVGHSDVTGSPPLNAVLWERGEVIPLGTLGGSAGFAVRINERGQIVGGARTPNGELHAFLWDNGAMSDLGTLPGETFSIAKAINKHGQVAGNSAPRQPTPPAFFGECPANPVPPQPQRAVLWENGEITDLGTLGGIMSLALGINDHGDVVGSSTVASGEEHAFLLRHGTMTDLGTLGGTYSVANQINNRRQVVGLSRIATGELHAFLWEDGVMTDLNDLIPADSGFVLAEATAVNRNGQIVGVGTIDGQTHGLLLRPNDDED